MNYQTPEDTRRINFEYNKKKTWSEVGKNILLKTPAMGLTAVGMLAILNQLPDLASSYGHLMSADHISLQSLIQPLITEVPEGLHNILNFGKDLLPQVVEAIDKGGPGAFGVGLLTGGIKNAAMINRTLKSLEGKTSPSTGHVFETITDENGHQVKIFNINCSDARVLDKTGGDFPGSYAMFGAELRSLIESGLWAKIMNKHSNIAADFLAGYFIGSNILTTKNSLGSLMHEIQKCILVARGDNSDPNARIKIIMHDHFNGCGAEAFTSIPSYVAKFGLHNLLHSADILAVPNEVLGYMVINSIGSFFTALSTGGQVNLSAVLHHSEMRK